MVSLLKPLLAAALLHVALACQPPMGAYGPGLSPYGNYFGQGVQKQQQPSSASSFGSPLFSGVPASANSLDSESSDELPGAWSTEAPTNTFGDAAVDCSNGIRTAFEFLGCTEITEFIDAGDAGDAGSVFCNFKKGERCRFHNAPFEKLPFRRAKFRSSGEKFERTFREMTRRPEGSLPNGAFLFVGEPFGKPKEYQAAVEAKIACQKGDGKLRFRHWKTSENITLRVCTRDSEIRACTEVINYNFEEVRVNVVNPEKYPFFVEIIAGGFTSPSLFAIDDVEYEAEFCGGDSVEGNAVSAAARGDPTFQSSFPIEKDQKSLVAVRIQPKPPTNPGTLQISFEESNAPEDEQSLPIHKMSNCELIGCDFSLDLCKYRNGMSDLFGYKYGEWKVAKGRVGNFLTGIRTSETSSEGYAYVGTDNALDSLKGRRVYVLESSPFSLNADATLLFDVYRRARAISLQVCLDSLANCPYEIPQIDKRVFWRKNETAFLPRRTKKIFFVATQWQKFKWLAIANVRLGAPSCQL
ncbi:hypothetical protein QR680_005449 [Steinernema hermaphroditum]|uniref:MAM domain-containing protein n=1 Tax=Steinernema hermaphroditum TaxID=289476 RepID=A0AA39HTC1_9BILA|nr:hypothetical protein QR680_005449 [Steinernema hermaphroditum]